MIRMLPRGSSRTIALAGDDRETAALWLAIQKVEQKRAAAKRDRKPHKTHELFGQHAYGKNGKRRT